MSEELSRDYPVCTICGGIIEISTSACYNSETNDMVHGSQHRTCRGLLIRRYIEDNPKLSVSDIVSRLGIALRTAFRYRKEVKNGHKCS